MPRGPATICPISGCHRTRAAGHVMCRMHWRKVSQLTQHAVHKAWNAWRDRDEVGLTLDALEELWDTYRTVRQDAIDEASHAS